MVDRQVVVVVIVDLPDQDDNTNVHSARGTGVFATGSAFASTYDRPSLAGGKRVLAIVGAAMVTDCSDLDWIDVDGQPALERLSVGVRWLSLGLEVEGRTTL